MQQKKTSFHPALVLQISCISKLVTNKSNRPTSSIQLIDEATHMGNWIDLIFKRYAHLYFLTILKIDVTHVSLGEYSWFRMQLMNEGNDTCRNANKIPMAKCTMLSNDKLAVGVIALVAVEH